MAGQYSHELYPEDLFSCLKPVKNEFKKCLMDSRVC